MTDNPTYQFNQREKLKSRKLIESLFATGSTFLVFPIKVVYKIIEERLDYPIKVGVGTSTKKFKKAVDRNRIKRLLREHYRLNKEPLVSHLNSSEKRVVIFFMYIDKVLPENALLQRKMPVIIDKLILALNENNSANI